MSKLTDSELLALITALDSLKITQETCTEIAGYEIFGVADSARTKILNEISVRKEHLLYGY